MPQIFGLMAAAVCGLVVSACASIMPRVVEPIGANQKVVIAGFGEIRTRGDVVTPVTTAYLETRFRQIISSRNAHRRVQTAEFLAISGGGADGAFSAGLLNGWSAAGTRPEFEVVTGVSTGALAAPFAFLGPAYDRVLKRIYTDTTDADIYTSKGPIGVLGESLLDSMPLRKRIEAEMSEEVLDAFASEFERGRRLLIQTTDIERQIPYIWDITRIATHRNADRRRLITDILLASAAVPGAFPPVRINVIVDGHEIEELHVDGGLASQVFFTPPGLELATFETRFFGKPRTQRMTLIRNGKLVPETQPTEPRTLPLAARAVSTLIKYQSLQDIYRIRSRFQRPGTEFRIASIPASFNQPLASLFDQTYMRALYKVGYAMGLQQSRAATKTASME